MKKENEELTQCPAEVYCEGGHQHFSKLDQQSTFSDVFRFLELMLDIWEGDRGSSRLEKY